MRGPRVSRGALDNDKGARGKGKLAGDTIGTQGGIASRCGADDAL